MKREIISLLRSIKIQKRVIGALILREIITRYGRQNIGFLWLFAEPLLLIFLIVVFIRVRGGTHADSSLIAFVLTGYSIAMMWRNGSNRSSKAIGANIGMLFHRNVRVLDLFLSRLVLEVAGATVAFSTLMFGFYMINWVKIPNDILYMTYAWILMAWFSFGLGLIVGALSERFETVERFWAIFSFVIFPLSGVFFKVDSLSPKTQEIVLAFPMIHGTEMIRHGYFGAQMKTHESISYLVICNVIMTFIGLILVKKYSQGVEPS